jgi:metallo-beta-lactamase family protein
MAVKLSFLGAAENVTGSRFLLEANGSTVLVDCGLYQERQLLERNWDSFPTPPADIDAVLLTHAHLDHCGWLPKLVKDGFTGKVYCTDATAQIGRIVLLDCGHIQEEDAEFKRKRHKRRGKTPPRPVVPLYTGAEAEACFGLFSPVKYEQTIEVTDGIEATFYDAGHILGASMINLTVKSNGQTRTILFSGDVGREGKPILRDPSVFAQADYVLVESTYGDRTHDTLEDTKEKLAQAVRTTKQAGGNIVVPSFAIERSQEVLYYLNELLLEDNIPHLMVFLDSPMAIRVTEVFKQHSELFDDEMAELLRHDESPFDFTGLKMARTTKQSKAINHIRGTVMIIAGSGMCTGGRVKHHLVNNISRPESTILFVGYQAVGTLGRQIVEEAGEVRILGQMYDVKAKIVQTLGFSAHADKNELFKWLSNLKNPPRHVFVVHGETNAAHHFSNYLNEQTGWTTSVPTYGDKVTLD